MSAAKHIQTGQHGEELALSTMQDRGFRLVERNWRCAAGELDAVMFDGDELVFIEVKTRVGQAMGSAEEALSAAKARKVIAAAEWYLADHPEVGDPIWRIDLVAITLDSSGELNRISHIANAGVIG